MPEQITAKKIPDYKAYQLLEKYKIPIARYGLFKEPGPALSFAKKLEFPVVLKIDGGVIHKRRQGCVKMVYEEKDFNATFSEIMTTAKKLTNEINGIIVQEFIEGQESIIGSKLDSQFGHVIMFGSGGVLAEIIHDISFRLLPITKDDACAMIKDTKLFEVLRQMKPREKKIELYHVLVKTPFSESFADMVVDVLVNVSKLIAKNPKISEMDINPLMITDNNVVAVDVRIIE
jgi:acyl-CoA synthetase (NDP forming)